MVPAYVQLSCPSCDQHWEEDPSDLPPPSEQFKCSHCGATRSLSEFAKTHRDLQIMKEL